MPQRHSLTDMDLRQLRYFRRVAERGSFSKAAQSLDMTQPALSRQVLELETELGHELFERTPKGATPTPAGLALYRHLDLVFAQLDRIPEIIATASRGHQLVRVGVPPGVPHEWFLYLLAEAKREHPEIAVSLHEASSHDQLQLIDTGLIEVAVVHRTLPGLTSTMVLSQRVGLSLSRKSPLAERVEVTFADLDGMRIMAHATGAISVEESHLRAETAKAGVEIDWVFRQFSEHSSLIAASSEVDAVLVTEASARRHTADPHWIPLQAVDEYGEQIAVRTFLAWREPAHSAVRHLVTTMIAATARFQTS